MENSRISEEGQRHEYFQGNNSALAERQVTGDEMICARTKYSSNISIDYIKLAIWKMLYFSPHSDKNPLRSYTSRDRILSQSIEWYFSSILGVIEFVDVQICPS